MKNDLNVRTVGIVGCGLIGMSWAAYYLAKGFAVRATDPVAGAEEKLRAYIDSAWALLEEMGLEPGERGLHDSDPRTKDGMSSGRNP